MKKKKKFKPTSIKETKVSTAEAVENLGVVSINKVTAPEVSTKYSYEENAQRFRSLKDLFRLLKSNIIMVLLLSIISFAVYWQVIRGEFLNIDDLAGIVQNPTIKDLKSAFNTGLFHQMYLAVIFKLFGLNSTAYHVVSIILHIFNCVLVFIFTYMVFGKRVSVIATALFVVNPTGSEAINWLSASGYLHSTALALTTLMIFSLYRRSKDPWYFIGATALYGINLLLFRIAWALVVPFLIFLLDVLILNPDFNFKKTFKYLPTYIPLIVFSLIFVYSELIGDFKERAYTLETQHYLSIKAATPYLNRIPYSVYMIGRQYVFPLILTIYHEGRVISNPEYTAMIISTLIYVTTVAVLLKKNKTYAALLLMIPVATLPSFSPVAIAWLVAERYLYLGAVFYCILLAKMLIDLETKVKLRSAAKVFGTLIFIAFFVRTFVRADDFSTSKKLWLSTMKAAPLSYRVYNNLGDVYANQGEYELAIQNFARSLELKPDYADAVHNLGFTYMQMGDANNARYFLQKSFEMNPRLYQSLFKLGYIEMQLGNYEGAKYYMQKTLEVNPGNTEAIQLMNTIINAEKAAPSVVEPSSASQ